MVAKAAQKTQQRQKAAKRCLGNRSLACAHSNPLPHQTNHRPQPWRSRQWPATWARTRRSSKWTVVGWRVCLGVGRELEAAAAASSTPSTPPLLWSLQAQPGLTRIYLHVHSHRNPVVQLYRTISKELPRVLTIYDADLAPAEVRPGGWEGRVGWGGVDFLVRGVLCALRERRNLCACESCFLLGVAVGLIHPQA